MQTTLKTLDYIAGSVERITFHSEETGFCVLRTNSDSRPALNLVSCGITPKSA